MQISTVLGVAVPEERADNAWTEGVAIWVAILVVSLVGAFNDWNKDRQFQKLNALKDIIDVKASGRPSGLASAPLCLQGRHARAS